MTSEKQAPKRKAFWTDKSCRKNGVWEVNIAVEDDPHFYPWNTGWPSLGEAQAHAEEMNDGQGHTADDVEEIIASAHRAAAKEREQKEMLDLTPDRDGMIWFARKILREADSGSQDAEVARKVLAEYGEEE
jgi:hypothetical protein